MKYFIDVSADATGLGKSLIAGRLADHLMDCGLPVTYVRIESRRVTTGQRPDEVFIATEEIARSHLMPGGIVGVLAPAFDAAERLAVGDAPGAVVIDWAGGLGGHRLEALAASGIGDFLHVHGVVAISAVVTTAVVERLEEAASVLAATADYAPALQRLLVLNHRIGGFDAPATTPVGRATASLLAAHGASPVLEMPRIAGDSWAYLQSLGLSLGETVRLAAGDVAERLGCSTMLAHACLAHCAAWHTALGERLDRLGFFREVSQPEDPQGAGGPSGSAAVRPDGGDRRTSGGDRRARSAG